MALLSFLLGERHTRAGLKAIVGFASTLARDEAELFQGIEAGDCSAWRGFVLLDLPRHYPRFVLDLAGRVLEASWMAD